VATSSATPVIVKHSMVDVTPLSPWSWWIQMPNATGMTRIT
jgi:hypothetical protein